MISHSKYFIANSIIPVFTRPIRILTIANDLFNESSLSKDQCPIAKWYAYAGIATDQNHGASPARCLIQHFLNLCLLICFKIQRRVLNHNDRRIGQQASVKQEFQALQTFFPGISLLLLSWHVFVNRITNHAPVDYPDPAELSQRLKHKVFLKRKCIKQHFTAILGDDQQAVFHSFPIALAHLSTNLIGKRLKEAVEHRLRKRTKEIENSVNLSPIYRNVLIRIEFSGKRNLQRRAILTQVSTSALSDRLAVVVHDFLKQAMRILIFKDHVHNARPAAEVDPVTFADQLIVLIGQQNKADPLLGIPFKGLNNPCIVVSAAVLCNINLPPYRGM